MSDFQRRVRDTLMAGTPSVAAVSMLLSLVVYGLLLDWAFAIGMIAVILLHELGHYVAARQLGIPVGLPTFIPLLGAYVVLRQRPANVESHAYVLFAGPIAGSVAALGAYVLSQLYDSDALLEIAYFGLLLNLFNLLPIPPMDGAGITAIVSPRIAFLGGPFVMLALLLFMGGRGSLTSLLLALTIVQFAYAWRHRSRIPENSQYYDSPRQVKIEFGVLYVALTALLAMMIYELRVTIFD